MNTLVAKDDAPECPKCGQKYEWNEGVNAFEHDDPCIAGALRRAIPEEEAANSFRDAIYNAKKMETK